MNISPSIDRADWSTTEAKVNIESVEKRSYSNQKSIEEADIGSIFELKEERRVEGDDF